MPSVRNVLALAAFGAGLVQAHMQLQYPPPINSKYDPQTPQADIDYSMTSPLLPNGSNYPCKGYNTPEAYQTLKPVATLKAGTDFEIEFAPGGANHGGGSCQFSISYDQGKTFAVIHSIIGGCPLELNYSVPIPSNLPSAESATFAWTWFNEIGNREEYMNCAIVDIDGSSDTSFTGPGLYRANTLPDGTCITIQNVDVVFPNPGPSVAYGNNYSSSSPVTKLDPCSYNEDTTVTITTSGSSSSASGSNSSSAAAPSSSSSSAASSSSSSSTPAASASGTGAQLAANGSSSAPASSSTAPATSDASTASAQDATSSAASSSAADVSSTASSSGTLNKGHEHRTKSAVSATGSALTTSAAAAASAALPSTPPNSAVVWINCTSPTTFSICDASGCTDFGSVSAGTTCVNGAIVALPVGANATAAASSAAAAASARMMRVRRAEGHVPGQH
ncbi:hypothetical protein JCM5296_006108 [Sporobolomyces johnsonii]